MLWGFGSARLPGSARPPGFGNAVGVSQHPPAEPPPDASDQSHQRDQRDQRDDQSRQLDDQPYHLDERFRTYLGTLSTGRPRDPREPVRPGSRLTGEQALRLYDAQLTSRHLDLAARWLRGMGAGYYTISSAGHEGNAAVAAALRPSDPALLHYRSGGFYCARADQPLSGQPLSDQPLSGQPLSGQSPGARTGTDPVGDVLRGVVAAATEPIAGGRHKVFGSVPLAVVPTTSTIASHLPRAVGLAFAIERSRRLGVSTPWPRDAVAVCSFGDASINHATATAALNTAGWCRHLGLPLPLLLVCEDNGLGISVPSPPGWVAAALGSRPGLEYLAADGCDLAASYDTAVRAVELVRKERRPAVLHLSMVRLMGHAGSDAETAYRGRAELAADAERDPLAGTARLLAEAGVATADELLSRYDEMGWQVRTAAEEVLDEPKLASAAEIMAPLAPRRPDRITEVATRPAAPAARATAFGGRLPEDAGPVTLAQAINAALADGLASHPGMIVFGEDVAVKGGVYGVTKGLRDRFGAARVFDTLLDETSILGLALGAGLAGLLPVPEIQYLAYLHNAEDQLRGEAATMGFFSAGAYRNPMVVRVASVRLPARVRRALPQRQLGRRAAGRTRAGTGRPGAAGRRRRDAAYLPGRRGDGRRLLCLSGADRALPHP